MTMVVAGSANARSSPPRPRLAGFQFETISPPPDEILPRMDLTAFVGFAERGPLDVPVAIEDTGQFATIFGGDVPLAWDAERNEQISAYLGPAVRGFFRNGGRRCWVIRVADAATPGIFPLSGLVRLAPGHPQPAFAQASSEGSWSDTLRVGTALVNRLVDAVAFDAGRLSLRASVLSTDELVLGDLVRVTFAQAGLVLFWVVSSIRPTSAGTPATVLVSGATPTWFTTQAPTPVQNGGPLTAHPYTADTAISGDPEHGLVGLESGGVHVLKATWPSASEPDAPIEMDVALDLADAPPVGAIVRVDSAGGDQLWLTVQQTDSPTAGVVTLTGQGLWWLGASPPAGAPLDARPLVERLTFELSIWQDGTNPVRIAELGLAPAHPNYWANLPTDRQRYAGDQLGGSPTPGAPFAGCGPSGGVYLPIAMPSASDASLALGRLRTQVTALERNGLSVFGSQLFVDPALAETGVSDLQAEADFVRVQSPNPRRLTGIHAALDLDEVTLVAVPDAIHRRWTRLTTADPLPPITQPAQRPSTHGQFAPLRRQTVAPPGLSATVPDEHGTFTISWSAIPNATYLVEESDRPDWLNPIAVYAGSHDTHITLYGRAPDDYYYRARASVDGTASDWSSPLIVRVQAERGWYLEPRAEYVADGLLAVHQAVLRMCSARGDLFAILSMPEHFREGDAATYAARLAAATGQADGPNVGSYGAMYYPWLVATDIGSAEPSSIPADGHLCGQFATLALTRGAWIAPANTPLRGAVGLNRPVPRGAWVDLLQGRINTLRQDVAGCVAQSAYCLGPDAEVQAIVVRRLLGLLRRLALREGAAYVFEPNGPTFLRRVQAGFEGVLDLLFSRGALAGARASEAFQVVVSTLSAADQGGGDNRLIVELRVAPSLPLTFVTVRLLQTNTGLQVRGT